MDSVDREVKDILCAEAAKCSDFNKNKQAIGIGTAISNLYDAIFRIASDANLSPGQAREVLKLIPAAFAYGESTEAYRKVLRGM